ncbi:ER degradation-enhancing alpha-mannosidase-like protein 2 [Toxocara canis]|uniref:ER degradation-enhancing alpha-mannosidase-like protein 2 n=1 Tax=Toxocara canis TaxID=6265 RepID=A0A0B2W581_TOXCA|nr:ER degradation-enhancing alpha-mannosidase-like protein 2 [Toxocara canis]
MYERVALKALDALWKSRSPLGLVGNHINVQTGAWTATDSGIGAGVDSYFEYLAKGALLFQRPNLMHQFNEYVKAINAHVRKDDWFMWVSMTKGQVSLPVFQSLEAFWPGILALTGNVDDAQRIIFQYSQIIRQYGFPPEFYNIPSQEAVSKRSGYPLRPEFVESLYYIYRATRDPALLHMAASVIEAIEHSCRTACGYATIENVNDHTIEDRMESFFLSETTKYLYLLFDPENFINNDGTTSRTVETPNGPCIVDAGGYIFNTEAHPLDPGAIYCCSAKRNNDIEILRRFEDSIDFSDLIDLSDPFAKKPKKSPMLQKKDLPTDALELLTDHREQRSGHIAKPQNEENAAQAKKGEVSYSSESQRDETDSLWRISPSAKPSSTLPVGNTEKEDETLKEKAASEKLKKLLLRARQFDEKMEFEGKGKSELAAALMKALKTMQDELVSVVGASNHLSSMGKFEKQKRLDEMFIPVAECRNCCRAVDAKFDSLTLKRMMSLIYANYIYPRTGIVSINGPVCAPGEEPSLEDEYSNQWPDVSEIETRQALDPIDEIRFGSMRYRSLAREHYELLSSPPLSYLSQFTGLGQVTLRSLNETPLHI